MQLFLETMSYADMIRFLSYSFLYGLGIGYAWRAYFQFFG